MGKLTKENVHEVCKLLKQGVQCKEIAEKYGVTLSTISAIQCGRSYKDISKQYGLKSTIKMSKRLKPSEVEKISKLIIKGYGPKRISEMTGYSINSIINIKRRTGYSSMTEKYVFTKRKYKSLSDDVIESICGMMVDGYSNKRIMEILEKNGITINKHQLSGIRNKRYYKNITSKYDMPINTHVISDDSIHTVCQLLEKGYSDYRVYRMTFVSAKVINNIRTGNYRTDISSNYNIPKQKSPHLTEDEIITICKLLKMGKGIGYIADMLSIDYGRVYRLARGESYTNISKRFGLPLSN